MIDNFYLVELNIKWEHLKFIFLYTFIDNQMLICKKWYLFEKFLRNKQVFGTFGSVLELKEEKTTISRHHLT